MISGEVLDTFAASTLTVVTMVIVLFFLPAIIELKKPKDAGPRILIDNPVKITFGLAKIPIVDIEETQEQVFPFAIKNAGYLSTLPNMEF
ncbi:MAG: hypothetical protein ABSG33_06405 [Candidatus Bathyarchaeia archaeon]